MVKHKLRDSIFKSNRVRKKGFGSSFGIVKTLDFYTRIFADWKTNGVADEPPESFDSDKFYYTTNRIYTSKGIKKVYFIRQLPQTIPRGFITEFRDTVEDLMYKFNTANNMSETVYVNFLMDCEHYEWDMSSRRTQGRFSHFAREFEKVQAKAGNKTLQDELRSDKYTEQVRHKVNSFLYMKEALEGRDGGSAFYKTILAIELCATSSEALLEAEKAISIFSNPTTYNLKLKDVFIQTNDYNKAFTPVSHDPKNLLRQMQGGDVFTDETLASFTLTTHGRVGDEFGIYHGVDLASKNIVTFDFSKGEDASNVLLTASTGEGKSNYAKMLYTFITPLKKTYSTIVFDYEGTEYIPLGRVTNAKNVSFTGGSGSYVNTMVIADLTGDSKIDDELKINAVDTTTQVFNLLTNGLSTIEEAILSEAIKLVYLDAGVVDEDKSTWVNSRDCTFFTIFAKIIRMRDIDKYISDYGLDNIKKFIMKLKMFFEDGNTNRHWFNNPISVQELLDSQNIIYNFGMGGKDKNTENPKSLALRQMFASYLTFLLASRNKTKGLKTVVFFEELQRYLELEESGRILNNVASGGRKLGIIAYYITNTPSDLFALSESANEAITDNLRALLASISHQIIGALPRNEMELLIQQFNLTNALSYLDKLVAIRENEEANSPLKYCFFVKYKGQSTIVRMLSHPDLAELPLYKTLKDSNTGFDEDAVLAEDERRLRLNIGEDAYDKKFKEILDEDIVKNQEVGQDKWSKRLMDGDSNSRFRWDIEDDNK